MSRLLLLSCSARKRPHAEPLPAIERYDGPTFRVLRRYIDQQDENDLSTYVLSARHGVISGSERVANYDQPLTAERAQELQPQVKTRLHEVALPAQSGSTLVCAGGRYVQLLKKSLPATADPEVVTGPVGRQLSGLYRWLYGTDAGPTPDDVGATEQVVVQVRGTTLQTTRREALQALREAFQAGNSRPGRFQTWHVVIDGEPVSAKWAVAQLTGLGRGDFHTDDAKRVLKKLGLQPRAQ